MTTATPETLETYTFTARDAENPDKVVTFTLDEDQLRLNFTGMLEKLGKIGKAEEKGSEARLQMKTQLTPAMIKLMQNFSGPVHLSDVDANLNGGEGERLNLTVWQRLGGLRLIPVKVNMGRVDNVEAAEAFVDELEERKRDIEPASRFSGPLDYWLGWLGVAALAGLMVRWLRRN